MVVLRLRVQVQEREMSTVYALLVEYGELYLYLYSAVMVTELDLPALALQSTGLTLGYSSFV